jgi:hypothetical protein
MQVIDCVFLCNYENFWYPHSQHVYFDKQNDNVDTVVAHARASKSGISLFSLILSIQAINIDS